MFGPNNQTIRPNNQTIRPNNQTIRLNNQVFKRNNEKITTIDLTTDSCDKCVNPSIDINNLKSKFPNLVILLEERVETITEKHHEINELNSNKIHKRKIHRKINWSNKKRKQNFNLKAPQAQISFVSKAGILKEIR
ncbi:hypothetical protein COBT_004109, partial [Conglomerata obtusa]